VSDLSCTVHKITCNYVSQCCDRASVPFLFCSLEYPGFIPAVEGELSFSP
jgi:hypothetical protein